MGKRLIIVLALALLVGLTFSAAYAEVQNVKVSGDITMSGVLRKHFGLMAATAGDKSVLKQSFLMSQTRVRVDADLTDNVMATVRLINERIWNGQNDLNTANSANSTNIDLDLAFVTLKEFLYSPLTLTVGRQNIKFGNGLVIGKSGASANTTNIPTDLSERRAFDAIRATLDYDPLVVDLVYAKVRQTTTVDRNDIVLSGVNAAYALNKKTNISGYFYLKNDDFKAGAAASRPQSDKVKTVGVLVTSTPIDNLNASLEAAYQFGRNSDATNLNQKRHSAWALQAMADYTFVKVKTTPKVGASYTYLSGRDTGNGTVNEGWDPMFYDQALNGITYALLPMTNMSVLNLKASCKPVEDVTLAANYGYYDVAQKNGGTLTSPSTYDAGAVYLNAVAYTGESHLGDALDLTAVYDYTEDVQFSLTGGLFRAGNAITIASDKQVAQQVIGSMKVTF
ncbi:MAG: alginate export family protein [Candidatus Omnitrophica bacterium]|nr:alginate export family protein [Candidatus Omnitrophota bacterium]MBU1923854.1 alginate export family protein [Candidatus Omnitrophota bacterium]